MTYEPSLPKGEKAHPEYTKSPNRKPAHGTPIHLHDAVVGWRRKERKDWVAWGADGKYLGRHSKWYEATLAVINHAETVNPERKE